MVEIALTGVFVPDLLLTDIMQYSEDLHFNRHAVHEKVCGIKVNGLTVNRK